MSLFAWFAIAVAWLVIGTLLGMAKWAVFHDNTPAKSWSLKRALRMLLFPVSGLHAWETRRSLPDCRPNIRDFKSREAYISTCTVLGPLFLTILVPGLIVGSVDYAVRSVVFLTVKAVRLIDRGWERISRRDIVKNNGTQTAIARLTELRDNELVKQESHLLTQKNTLGAQVSRLQRERGTTEKRVELLTAADDQFADAYRVTLGRIERLLYAKQQELTCTEKALGAIKETIARLSGIVELIDVSAYMDTIDPRTNDSSQQLLRDAYACVEACRIIIARAQSISIGIQADTADVDELARQVDAGWTANEKQIRENGKLLERLAETPEPESLRPAPRLIN